MFWYYDKPSEGGIYSGINGINFEAVAASYGGGSRIKGVYIYYDLDDNKTGDWTLVGKMQYNSQDDVYRYTWTNQINDKKVWLRVEAVDEGDCESVSIESWIRIDSTKPKITNTKK